MKLDVERSRKECNPIKSPNCGGDPQILCVFSEIMERFVCCHRGVRSRNELKECPKNMIRDPKNQTCSVRELCTPPFICIRRQHDQVGICCRHRKSSLLITLQRLFFSHIVLTFKEFLVECPNNGTSHKDTSGQVKICNEKIICPQPYKCKLSDTPGTRSRICCMDPPIKKVNCPHKLLPLSADGQEQSCKHHNCPSGP